MIDDNESNENEQLNEKIKELHDAQQPDPELEAQFEDIYARIDAVNAELDPGHPPLNPAQREFVRSIVELANVSYYHAQATFTGDSDSAAKFAAASAAVQDHILRRISALTDLA